MLEFLPLKSLIEYRSQETARSDKQAPGRSPSHQEALSSRYRRIDGTVLSAATGRGVRRSHKVLDNFRECAQAPRPLAVTRTQKKYGNIPV